MSISIKAELKIYSKTRFLFGKVWSIEFTCIHCTLHLRLMRVHCSTNYYGGDTNVLTYNAKVMH